MPEPRRFLRVLFTAGIVAALSGCHPGADLPMLPDAPAAAYRLGVGDVLKVVTVGDTDLTGTFTVADPGIVALPLLGPVPAVGLTTPELAHNIADELKQRNLFRNPSVAVEVSAYRPFFILGEVNKPGLYPFVPGMTVLTAVSIGGGFTYRAVTDYAEVVRVTGDTKIEARIARTAFVKPGDTLRVYEEHF